jgi:hypothetical protein
MRERIKVILAVVTDAGSPVISSLLKLLTVLAIRFFLYLDSGEAGEIVRRG